MTPPAPPTDLARDADALVARLVARVSAGGPIPRRRASSTPRAGSTSSASTPTTTRGSSCPSRSTSGSRSPSCPPTTAGSTLTLAATGERDGFDLDAIGAKTGSWIDYIAGMAWALLDAGTPTRGFRGVLASDLPQGSGLSSSAALELASSLALSGGALPPVDRMALAQLVQRAENGYIGVNSGLMDQFASAFGSPGERPAARLPDAGAPRGPDAARRGGARRVPLRLAARGWRRRRTTSAARSARPPWRRSPGPSPASPRCAT